MTAIREIENPNFDDFCNKRNYSDLLATHEPRDMLPFLEISEKFSDIVEPASFPEAIIRHKNLRWQEKLGLPVLTDDQWKEHFARFEPLPRNLSHCYAMRYHGHQFGTYNPDLGDGRGFLFAQLQSPGGNWLDLGTKGSGQTPYSRQGDGRLTLKGGVREVLAAAYLEALGVTTSKAFSLIETGEALHRNDEPSPARSSVLVRLLHSHVRFGSFQRAAALGLTEDLAELVNYAVTYFHPAADDPAMDRKTAALLEQITRVTAKMIGQWMAAGFVHGVMNTDNFNLTGETFDFGPYRFCVTSDPNFTAAYFDQQGLYRFGRQPVQGLWALQQLASALTPLAEAEDLAEALKAYEPAYRRSFADHTLALLGLEPGDLTSDLEFAASFYAWMTETKASWPQTFFDWFGGPASEMRAAESPQSALYTSSTFQPVRNGLLARTPSRPDALSDPYFQKTSPCTLLYDDIEALWARIAERNDWTAYERKLSEIETARLAYGLAT